LAALGVEAIGASFRADPDGVAAAGGVPGPDSPYPRLIWVNEAAVECPDDRWRETDQGLLRGDGDLQKASLSAR
jgi:hypothetical protein